MDGTVRPRPGPAMLAVIVGSAVALIGAQGAGQAPERVRLLSLQREAASLIERAARPGNTAAETRAAGREALARLRELAADPPSDAGFRLSPDLRTEIR